MVHLSINVNKIATLRNARGGGSPNVCQVVRDLISFGAKGITVHPRPDKRHILYQDVRDIQALLPAHPNVEFNVEGFPDISFMKLIEEIKPFQCTLVPDSPSVKTSNAGWRLQENMNLLAEALSILKRQGVRSSLFVDPFTLNPHEWQALEKLKPDRAELYTEAYAKAWAGVGRETVTAAYKRAAQKLKEMKIAVNAGHDLNQQNLPYLLRNLPEIQEVSIGHAFISEALYQGLKATTLAYQCICEKAEGK